MSVIVLQIAFFSTLCGFAIRLQNEKNRESVTLILSYPQYQSENLTKKGHRHCAKSRRYKLVCLYLDNKSIYPYNKFVNNT